MNINVGCFLLLLTPVATCLAVVALVVERRGWCWIGGWRNGWGFLAPLRDSLETASRHQIWWKFSIPFIHLAIPTIFWSITPPIHLPTIPPIHPPIPLLLHHTTTEQTESRIFILLLHPLDPSQNQTIYFQIKLSKQFKSNFKTRNFYKRCKSKSHFQRRTNQYTQPPFL